MPAGPYMAAYYATKAYVVSLTSAVAEELREMHSPVYVGCLCPGPVNTEFNTVANVQFALKGITPEFCVRCALHGIHRRKTIIVPGPLVAAGMTLGRYLPRSAYIRIAAHSSRKSCIGNKKAPLGESFLLHPKTTQKTFLFLLFFLQGLCYNQYCIAICKQRRARLCQRRRNRAARAPKLNIPGRGIGHAPLRRLSSLPARPRPTGQRRQAARRRREMRRRRRRAAFLGTAAGILVLSGIITLILPKSVKGETEPEAPAVTGTTQLVAPLPYAGTNSSDTSGTVQTLNWGTVGPQQQSADTGYTYTATPQKSVQLGEFGRVSTSWFADAAFLGDSLTAVSAPTSTTSMWAARSSAATAASAPTPSSTAPLSPALTAARK